MITKIFDDKAAPDADPLLIRAYGKKLESGITKGYGKTLDSVDWDTPDYRTITALQNNVWQFSAAKTHTQLKDMGAALVDANGKIRTKQEFRIEARNIAGKHLTWLDTEYDTAIGSAQMAAKWQVIQEQKGTFPILEFDAVVDENSSNICPPLDKVRLPVDHPFWTKYYPPLHFKCRSTVRQLTDGKITPDDKIPYPEEIGKLFENNVGITGMVFPPGHAYYTDVPAHVIENGTLYMPAKDQYIVKYKAKDGTELAVHRKTDIAQGNDLDNLIKVGKALADRGYTVDILPSIHQSETSLRKALLPDTKPGKNPDLLVEGKYTEVKRPTDPVTFAKLQQNIKNAATQADRAIVLLEEEYDIAMLENAARDRFKQVKNLQEIGFVTADGEYLEYTRAKMSKGRTN